jgi:phenylpyruvate tautomerase PptA (4-oxalocrotonate tautomerase family)
MPFVSVRWHKGRDLEAKKKVAEAIAKAMEEVGVPKGVTHVVFTDVPKEEWFVPGRD